MAVAEEVAQEEQPVVRTRRLKDDTEMDITPMIDCVFLLLIFFTVTSVPDPQTALDLAQARFGSGISERESFVVAMRFMGEGQPSAITMIRYRRRADRTDEAKDPLLGTAAEQDERLKSEIETWLRAGYGNQTVLIKAERDVLHRDVARVAALAAQIDGVKLALGVKEAD